MIKAQEVVVEAGWVTVRLSQAESHCPTRCPSVVEVNRDGKWVHGIEVFMPPFNLGRAVQWLDPVPPGSCRRQGCVTYDPEADAAYLYLLFGGGSRSPGAEELQIAGSREIDAEWCLGEEGSLVAIRVPQSQASLDVGDFAALLRSDPFRALPAANREGRP